MEPNYKKLHKHYLKSTKNRDANVSSDWTAFRKAEKKYMARFPPPDLSETLDLQQLHHTPSVMCCEVSRASSRRNAYAVSTLPGLVVLPSFLNQHEQRQLVKWALRDHAKQPNETNLDVHYHLPSAGLWDQHLSSLVDPAQTPVIQPREAEPGHDQSVKPGPRELINNEPASKDNFVTFSDVPKPQAPPASNLKPITPTDLLPKLRWANIGWFYHWGTKQYDFSKGPGTIDHTLQRVCQDAVGSVDWSLVFPSLGGFSEWQNWQETYAADAGIVNFYQTKDTLMAHVDRSEVCATSPLVSISLGNSAIFLIGGTSRDEEPMSILLRSGDAVIMSGPVCRRAYHGVPRILENTLPSHLKERGEDEEWEPYRDYMLNSRINVNVRQVFPKGFNPAITSS